MQRVVVAVHHAFLELNDGIVGDLNACRADFGAASGDVAIFHAELFLDFRDPVLNIEGVHFVLCQTNEVSRPCKVVKQFVVAQDVAGVSARGSHDDG